MRAVASARRPASDEKDHASPRHPARRGGTSSCAAATSAAGVPPGRACHGPPRAGESHGAAGDSSAGTASRAGLRQPSSACGHSRAGLRQPGSARMVLAYAPPAAASRLPTAARSATALRPSASGAALGPHAPSVCLRHRAQPCPLRRPGLSHASRMARYGPWHLRPAAPRPPLPWLRLGLRHFQRAGWRGETDRLRVVGRGMSSPARRWRRRGRCAAVRASRHAGARPSRGSDAAPTVSR